MSSMSTCVCVYCGEALPSAYYPHPWTPVRCWDCDAKRTAETTRVSMAVSAIVARVGHVAWREARARHPELKPSDPDALRALEAHAELNVFSLD